MESGGGTQTAPKQWELVISPVGHDGLIFKAGQFVWLNVGNSVFLLHENPVSISSAPPGGQDTFL